MTPTTTTTEADVQAQIKALCRQLGIMVNDTSQGYRPGGKRHGTTRITLGFPDLVLIHPRTGVLFREIKRPGGKLTRHQESWHQTALRAGADVGVWDSLEAACEDLSSYGWTVTAS